MSARAPGKAVSSAAAKAVRFRNLRARDCFIYGIQSKLHASPGSLGFDSGGGASLPFYRIFQEGPRSMLKFRSPPQGGFTLLELLVVMVILGLLVGYVAPK